MKKLLAVCNNPEESKLPDAPLEKDYTIFMARSVPQALELLGDNPDIALILLDISSPLIEGEELMSALKANPTLSNIPVIVATDVMNGEITSKYYKLGAFEVIKIPCDPQMVPMRIARTIKLCESSTTLSAIERDPVTGLLNEHAFYHRAAQFASMAPGPLVATVSEICDFQVMEEAYGIERCREVMKHIGKFLIAVKDSAIAGYLGNGRIGVLALWIEGVGAKEVASSVKSSVETGPLPDLEVKIGLYENAVRDEDVRVSFRKASDALERIRGEYNEDFAIYDDQLDKARARQRHIRKTAESSLSNGDFYVVYQPKFHTDGTVCGAEALARWNHPDFGEVSPGEFIPLFERSGFVRQVDAEIRRMVSADLKECQNKGLTPVPVSVNLSKRELIGSGWEQLCKEVESGSLPCGLVRFEVTETMWSGCTEEVISNLESLRNAGYAIELDDFGSGYSNLSMLTKLPIDAVKLDMSIVHDVVDNPAIVRHCIELAHDLGFAVLAEGVEQEEQLSALGKLNCDAVQGFHLSQPISAESFEALLS